MSKKIKKFSVEWKLEKAKKNRNQREIDYYTQILDNRKVKIIQIKPSKQIKTKKKYVNPRKLASSRRLNLIKNLTISEKHICKLLKYIKYKCLVQYTIFTGQNQFYILDFYFPEIKLCLELDGKHHFTDLKQIEHDSIRDLTLKQLGIQTLRLSNSKAMSLDGESLSEIVKR